MRGTVTQVRIDPQRQRFIPACAGNRPTEDQSRSGSPVHPRVCGEQCSTRRRRPVATGSSPRVRGTDVAVVRIDDTFRFIPACAGNSPHKRVTDAIVAVHPRVCGEQIAWYFLRSFRCGSSPRVRGTGSAVTIPVERCRFIPACAGNRRLSRLRNLARSVHPRVCGEQVNIDPLTVRVVGSSPRVRGTGSGH